LHLDGREVVGSVDVAGFPASSGLRFEGAETLFLCDGGGGGGAGGGGVGWGEGALEGGEQVAGASCFVWW